jgi:hypothetical protein
MGRYTDLRRGKSERAAVRGCSMYKSGPSPRVRLFPSVSSANCSKEGNNFGVNEDSGAQDPSIGGRSKMPLVTIVMAPNFAFVREAIVSSGCKNTVRTSTALLALHRYTTKPNYACLSAPRPIRLEGRKMHEPAKGFMVKGHRRGLGA